MPDYGQTTTGLAEKLGVSRQTINELLLEKRAVSPAMALRLSRLFGNTPEFWLNAQRAVDLWKTQKENRNEIERIKALSSEGGLKNLNTVFVLINERTGDP